MYPVCTPPTPNPRLERAPNDVAVGCPRRSAPRRPLNRTVMHTMLSLAMTFHGKLVQSENGEPHEPDRGGAGSSQVTQSQPAKTSSLRARFLAHAQVIP